MVAPFKPESYETTVDSGKAVSEQCPGLLSETTDATFDPLGVLQHRIRLKPGESHRRSYLLTFGDGRKEAAANYRACPGAAGSLDPNQAALPRCSESRGGTDAGFLGERGGVVG